MLTRANACSLKNRRGGGKFFQVGIESVGILAEFDGQAGGAKLQISFLQIVEEAVQGVVI